MKKVSFGGKPQGSNSQLSPDDWVKDSQAAEPMKRLTIDVTGRLHTRIKAQCALRGVNMADELRKLLETHFPETDRAGGGIA